MKEKYGIQNLKIIVLALCQLQLLIQKILLNERKGWFGFIIDFIKILVPNFRTYLSFDFKQVDDEIKDLSKEETTELIDYISDNLVIKDKDKIVDFIKASVNSISKGLLLFRR